MKKTSNNFNYSADEESLSFFLGLTRLEDPLDLHLLPGNPDFDAKIGFLINSLEEYWILAPIAKKTLRAELIFGKLLISWERKKKELQVINTLARKAVRDQLYFRIFQPQSLRPESWGELGMQILLREESATIHDFFQKYSTLVSSRNVDLFAHPSLVHLKKILFVENPFWWPAEGGTIETLPRIISNIDAVVSCGKFAASLFEPFCTATIVGSPRLGEMGNRALNGKRKGREKRLLYIPDIKNQQIKELTVDIYKHIPAGYRLVVSFPYFRGVEYHRWVRANRLSRFEARFRGERDLSELVAEADVVLIENLECLLELIYFQKPTILLDRHFDQFVFWFGTELVSAESWKTFGFDKITGTDFGVILKDQSLIGAAIDEAIKVQGTKQFSITLARLHEAFLGPQSTGAAERAAKFIMMVNNKARPKESFLGRTREAQLFTSTGRKPYEHIFNQIAFLDPLRRAIVKFVLER